jgi:(2S)-methylsuccinyl-CoA dehydrogenase
MTAEVVRMGGAETGATLAETCAEALGAADTLLIHARDAVAQHVINNGKLDRAAMEEHQFAVHGFAWMATYVETLRQTLAWANRLAEAGAFGELESLILQAGFGEYLAQLAGGIPLSQGEMVRPADLWLSDDVVRDFADHPPRCPLRRR